MYSNNLSTTNQYIKYRIKTVETENDPTNNRTKIKVTVEAWRTNTGYETWGAGTCYVGINGTNYSNKITTSQKITYNSYTQLFSWEGWIDHNPDGSKTLYISSYIEHASFSSSSQGYDVTLTKYPRMATLTYAPSFTDEENPTITYSNPAGEAVTSLQACITADWGTVLAEYRDIPKTGTSYTFNFTEEERSRLRYATLDNGANIPIKFYVKTVIGGNTYYSPQSKTLQIVNATPEITCSIEDVGAASLALTGNKDILIKGFNYVAASMSSVCKKGATIESQTIKNGSQQLIGETGGNHSMQGGFNNVESGDFIFSLTDNRGITVNKTITKEIIPYIKLTCNLKPNKPNAEGELTLNVSGNYWVGNFGAIDNYLAVEYRIKAEDSDWSGWTLINDDYSIQNGTYSVDVALSGLDYKKAYTLQARAQDRVELIPSAERTVKAIPVYDWGENDFKFNVPVYDNLGAVMSNGLAVYDGSIDPDTTIDHLVLTESNTPTGEFMYIQTFFYSAKTETANRAQIAVPYMSVGSIYYRYYFNGAWSEWIRFVKEDEIGEDEPNEIYSYEEQVIGKWCNGKPLYRKTIELGALPNKTTKTVAHNVADISSVVRVYGYSTNYTNYLPLPYAHPDTLALSVTVYATKTHVGVQTGTDRSAYGNTAVTIEYVKSTDTAS